MQKHYLAIVVIFITLTILLYSTITLAHIPKQLPFVLQIQKNITHQWTPVIELEKKGYVSYIEGGGGCSAKGRHHDFWVGAFYKNCGFSGYQIQLFDNTTLVTSIRMLGGNCAKLAGPLIYLNASDNAVTVPRLDIGYQATNITFNGTPDCCGLNCGALSGKLEIHQFIKNISTDKVEINAQPVQLGAIKELAPEATLSSALTRPSQILDENILVQSPDKDIMVWFGTNDFSAGSRTTTELESAQVWACADLDWNGECDSKQATEADCTTALDKDYYKGECCTKTRIETNGCQYLPTINAYCGLTANEEAQFATPHEGGQIHDFRGCKPPALPQQLAFDKTKFYVSTENGTTKLKGLYNETKYFTCAQATVQEFIAVGDKDLHEYYCDKTKTEMYECGGNEPYSTLNTRTTGKNITINGKTNYCLEQPKKFTTNLDYATNHSCYNTGDFSLQNIQSQLQATQTPSTPATPTTGGRKPHTGQIWTGTRCCSEEDDILGNDNNEYYSEDYTRNSENYTRTIGGCWNSTYIPAGKTITTIENYAPTALNNSVINYNGTFYGCLLTDTKLLQMQNTDHHLDQRVSPVSITKRDESINSQAQTFSDDQLITIQGQYSGFYNFPSEFFAGSTLTPEEVVKVTDRIYLLEVELSNGKWIFNSFAKGTYDSAVYGTSSPEGFVLGYMAAPKNNKGHHSWDVIAHEMGHTFWMEGNTVNGNNLYFTLAVPGPFLQEATAVLTAQYVYERIKQDYSHFNLPQDAVTSLDFVFNEERNYQKSRYDKYIGLGKPYSQDESGPNYAALTSQAMNYKWFLIGDAYGWDKFPKFYKGFSADLKDRFTFWQDGVSDTEETTYIIAALNVAFNRDFRQDFKDLNFPISDTLYNEIYPIIKNYVG